MAGDPMAKISYESPREAARQVLASPRNALIWYSIAAMPNQNRDSRYANLG
jgi:hypothetical protein